VRTGETAAETAARERRILTRMLADCDELCTTGDALLVGQYLHLRGRIAALLDITTPLLPETGA
jgi:hypothetical protein